jgi:hypothetical protein
LHHLTIHLEPQVEVLRILDLVSRDEPGTDRRKAVGAFPFDPLPFSFQLKSTLADIIVYASSTSQSVLTLPFGITMGSWGPLIDEVALKKSTGSRGIAMPLSFA